MLGTKPEPWQTARHRLVDVGWQVGRPSKLAGKKNPWDSRSPTKTFKMERPGNTMAWSKASFFLFSFKKKNYTWYVPQRVGKLLWSQFLRDIYQLPVVFGDTPAVDLHICLCTNGSWSWHGCPNETSATTKLGLDWKFTGISWQIQEDNWDSDKTGMKTCSPIHVQWHLYWGPLLMSPMIAPPRSRPTVSPEVSDRRDDGRC